MMYEPHEFSLAFPEMTEEQFRRLAVDIRRNGLLHDIVLYEGKILDGRHRYRACLQEHIQPRTREYTEQDPAGFVASENAARRHLNESQIAMGGVKLGKIEAERAKARQEATRAKPGEAADKRASDPRGSDAEKGRTAEIISQKLGIGKNTFIRAAKVSRKGEPEVVRAVEQGRMTVTEAARVVDLNPAAQRRIAAVENKQQRSNEISKASHRSEAATARHNPPTPIHVPGTKFIRQFLGRLEHMTTDLESQFHLKTGEQITSLFLEEFDWNEEQLSAQLQRVMPVLLGIASIYDHVNAKAVMLRVVR